MKKLKELFLNLWAFLGKAKKVWDLLAFAGLGGLVLSYFKSKTAGSETIDVVLWGLVGSACIIILWSFFKSNLFSNEPKEETFEDALKKKKQRQEFIKQQFLADLANDEKKVLKEFVDKQASSVVFTISNGTVMGLVRKEVLYQATTISVGYTNFAFNIETWILRYLTENPKLLEVKEKGH